MLLVLILVVEVAWRGGSLSSSMWVTDTSHREPITVTRPFYIALSRLCQRLDVLGIWQANCGKSDSFDIVVLSCFLRMDVGWPITLVTVCSRFGLKKTNGPFHSGEEQRLKEKLIFSNMLSLDQAWYLALLLLPFLWSLPLMGAWV